ncbi:MAG: glycosyltransferase family 2 protein [Candidatus Taylorbacteria bacterium]|nr:glycosyltransferase family 2 protein [Candidatus Taylorbacteria bacterium]
MNKLMIVMPAYNEEANIESVIKQWHPVVEKIGNNSKLVIFDDGSKDDTFAIMQRIQSKYPYFVPITKKNSGHGATCLYAYRYAVENGAEYVFQTDSDGQTLPEEFWNFWELRNECDFIIGSRKGRMDGFSRIVVTKVLKMVIFLIFRVKVTDANTPFRLMNINKLKTYLNNIPADFFLSNVLISTLIVKNKEKYKWIPITFKPRQGGVNSINIKRIFKIGAKAVKDFLNIKNKLIK